MGIIFYLVYRLYGIKVFSYKRKSISELVLREGSRDKFYNSGLRWVYRKFFIVLGIR